MKIRGLECLIRVLLSVVKRPGLIGVFLSNFFTNTGGKSAFIQRIHGN